MKPEDRKGANPGLMFWLGVVYLTVVVNVMTPYTYQLDDIKVTMIHVLGPPLFIAYWVLVALGRAALPTPGVLWSLVGYFTILALSSLVSRDYCQWQSWQMTQMYFVLLGPFAAFFVVGRDPRRLRHAFTFLTLLTLGSALFGALHHFGAAKLLVKYYEFAYGSSLREGTPPFGFLLARTFEGAQGTMLSVILNRNFYAAFLLLMLPIVLGSALITRSRWWRWIALLTIVLSLFCMAYTYSKVSYIALGMEYVIMYVLFFFFARAVVRYRRRLMLLFGGALTLVIPLALSANPDRIMAHLRGFGLSFQARAIIWSGALGIWKENPILGGGPGTFGILFPFHRRPDYFLYEISHRTIFAHNLLMDVLSESGLLGFVFFMAFLTAIFRGVLRRVRFDTDPGRRIMAVCLVTGMTGFLLNNLTSPNARWPIGAVNLWSVLGLMAGMISCPLDVEVNTTRERRGRIGIPLARRRTAWALAVVGVICWIGWLPSALRPQWFVDRCICPSAYYGVKYFRAAMANNRGLAYTGSGGSGGVLDQAFDRVKALQSQLAAPDLGEEERQQVESQLEEVERQGESYRQQALRYFETAVEICPTFVTSLYKLATLHYMGERFRSGPEDVEKSLQTYEKMQEYGPEYAQIRRNLGTVYARLARFRSDSDETRKELWEKSLENLRLAAQQSIDYNETYMCVSYLVQYASENPELREQCLSDALAIASRAFEDWRTIFEEDREIRRSTSRKREIREDISNLLVRVAQEAGDLEKEVRGLEYLASFKQDDERVIKRLVDTYREAGMDDRLEKFLLDRVEKVPWRPYAHLCLGELYIEQGRLRDAKREAILLQQVTAEPLPDSHYMLFRIYRDLGEKEKALEQARAYLPLSKDARRRGECSQFIADPERWTSATAPAKSGDAVTTPAETP